MTSIEEHHNQDHPVTLFAHIAARFEQIELSHWTAVVFAWLARHDGIGRCYFEDEEESPDHEVPHCITELEHETTDDEIAHGVSHRKKGEGAFPSSSVIASWLIEQPPHR
ncbi:MAG: hypothetical protein Q8L38_04795 [Pseudohongiella sp.]|nr:hypothetical protein [Pseudohongiella sp.]